MSLIGTLEQFGLTNVLQRCERYEKTGLLILKQGPSWIEFYLSAGHLLCVGPLRANANLGERLLHDGIISQRSLQETLATLHSTEITESQFARALLERGSVSRDQLRLWTINNTVNVLMVLQTWTTGEMYFDENVVPPADRLLVSMSLSSLLERAASALPAAPVVPTPPAPLPAEPVQPKAPVQPLRKPPTLAQPAPARSIPPMQVTPTGQSSVPTPHFTMAPPAPPVQHTPPMVPATPSPDVARVPTLMGASQFLDDSSYRVPMQASPARPAEPVRPAEPAHTNTGALHDPGTLSASELFAGLDFGSLSAAELVPTPDFDAMPASDPSALTSTVSPRDTGPAKLDSGFLSLFGSVDDSANNSLLPAVPVAQPQPPKRIDTSFMRPEMVLLPADLSAYREQNPQVQLTPDQWCLLTHVDGQTPLAVICQALNAAPELVCQVTGELIAEGLVYPSLPDANQSSESSPASPELVASGLGNGYVAPGYASATASPWSASMPAVPPVPGKPVETESQWGNGGNGAIFVPGRGWVAAPQPMQPLQSNGSMGMGAPQSQQNGGQRGIYAAPAYGNGY